VRRTREQQILDCVKPAGPRFWWRRCVACKDLFKDEDSWKFYIADFAGGTVYVCKKCCDSRESVTQLDYFRKYSPWRDPPV
jgi:hypothetical protein